MGNFWTTREIEPPVMPAVGKRGSFVLRVWPDGAVDIRQERHRSGDKCWSWPNVWRVDEFIGVLQHTRELGREHFGEDWGEMTDTTDTFDFQLDYSEPTTTTVDQWELVEAPQVVPGWKGTWATYKDIDTGIKVHIYASSRIQIASLVLPASLIDRLQSLKALAKKHFGPDWGNRDDTDSDPQV